jgi:hypothetical protein
MMKTRNGMTWLRHALALPLLLSAACHHAHNYDRDGGVGDGFNPFLDDGGMACATQSAKAELAPLDLLILVDTSASMDYQGKWMSVKSAMKSFVVNPAVAGLGLGLQYFPLTLQCNVDAYASPAVPIQVLPLGADDVAHSLSTKQMSGGTPTVPALEGAYVYLKKWATDNPTHKVALVMASDGTPDDSCIAASSMGLPNSLPNAVLTAQMAFTSDPPISTFVIGVGTETMALDQIATAGGGKAIFVDTNTDVTGAFLAALQDIRGNALSCQFAIPDANGQAFDFDHVNVLYTPSDMAASNPLVYVDSSANCGMAPGAGWYYDDPNNPQKVVLCADACQTVTASSTGRIDVVFGCKTIIP